MAIIPRTQERFDLRTLLVRAWHRLTYLRYDPTLAVAGVLVVVLTYLVLAPIGAMMLDAVRLQFRDLGVSSVQVGDWTTYYLERTFASKVSSALLWDPLTRTLTVSIAVSAIALLLGALLAWIIVRTDLWGRRWLAAALVIPYMVPSWTFAVAWLTLMKNRRIGGAPGFAESLGFIPPDWLAYGPLPIIICETFHYFPFAFLLFGSALRSLDTQLEESARVLGAPRGVILRRIVAPLLLPALMSALLLIFSRTIGTFGTPYMLGSPVRYTVLATSLYGNFKAGSPGVTAVIALVMILIGVSMVAMDTYLVRNYRRFITVGGKGAMRRATPLGKSRLPLSLLVSLIFIATTIVPLGSLLLTTVMIRPGVFTPDNFTLDFWLSGTGIKIVGNQPGLLRNVDVLEAAWNSVRMAGLAALACGIVGLFIGYVVVRLRNSRTSAFLRQVSFLPYLVPGIGFAAAYLSLFAVSRGPIPALYGTLLLVALAMSVAYLPNAARSGISAMMQLGTEPEEAAMICGAPWHQRILRIVIPIQKSALMTGILLPFITGMKELSLVIMLATPGTELLTTQVLRYNDYGYTQLASATVLVIVALIFTLTVVVQRVTGSGLVAGLER
jgi:iron(III) transport system permease protein